MSMNSAERGLPLSTARVVDTRSPFVRLAELIADVKPGQPAIDLGVGEPKHPVPDFVGPVIAANIKEFGRYPRNEGTLGFRRAAAEWAARRYRLGHVPDPDREVLVLNGSREGLFLGAIAARRHVATRAGRPAILVPNPFYAAYSAGAVAADCEVVYMPTTRATGFLPDLDALDGALLARTVAMFLATPSNPQGAVADLAYLQRVTAMARRYGFQLFCDECYSEIYTVNPPAGALEAAGDGFENVVLFQSLSKRSNLPGLRIGFAMGDRRFIAKFLELRNVAAPQVPIPTQEVAVAAYGDEVHVEANRDLYRQKFDLADQIIGDRFDHRRPAGGFFLWLDVSAVGGSEAAAAKLWREAGVRVLPGRYIARDQADGSNPGADYIRVAMVHDKETTAEALHRIVAVLE
jgi:N-succinyldiaminopimelate aminotransferase